MIDERVSHKENVGESASHVKESIVDVDAQTGEMSRLNSYLISKSEFESFSKSHM